MTSNNIRYNNELEYFGEDFTPLSLAKNYYQWITDEFKPYLGFKVAEVGAGCGNFSDFLLNVGINQLFTFEPAKNIYPLLEKKYQNNNRVVTINSFFEDKASDYYNYFHSVVYVNVLEHIKNDRRELCHAYKTLKKHGYILIFVPALSWLYSELDKIAGHYRRYTKKELVKLTVNTGFSIQRIFYFDIAGIIPWYIAFVLLKLTTNKTNVSLYERFIVPPMRIIENNIKPPIGKNLLLVGKKK